MIEDYIGEMAYRVDDFKSAPDNLKHDLDSDTYEVNDLKKYFQEYAPIVKSELSITEPKLDLSIEDNDLPAFVIDEDTQFALLNSLYACPHGVYAMSREIEEIGRASCM